MTYHDAWPTSSDVPPSMLLECTDFLALVGVYCEGVKGALTLLTGLQNGVTHLLISPDGNTLHAGYRKVYLSS